MADAVTDERVAGVLRPFVRAAVPVLQVLRESDPLRLGGRTQAAEVPPEERLDGAGQRTGVVGAFDTLVRTLDRMHLPGSTAWRGMSVGQRCDWWAGRVGTVVALAAGLPRFGGVVTSRLPIRNALGLAGQGLVLTAIAGEHGLTERGEVVRLLAKVLLDREIAPDVASGAVGGSREQDDARTAELTEEIEESRRKHGWVTPRAFLRTVWRMARALWEFHSELDKRPQGKLYHQLIGNVPVIGVVGGYLGERSALRTVARQGTRWIRANHPPRASS